MPSFTIETALFLILVLLTASVMTALTLPRDINAFLGIVIHVHVNSKRTMRTENGQERKKKKKLLGIVFSGDFFFSTGQVRMSKIL